MEQAGRGLGGDRARRSPTERRRPSTYAASRSSSCSASATVSRSRKPRSSGRYAVNPAARLPARSTAPIGRMSGVRRRRDRGQDGVQVGADAVDLVDEQQRRHAEPLQRAHQDPGLRLDALDRREHEHRAVEDAQRALDLGDEVGVAGGVDDVDGHVAERERDDGGPDGDAAAALEREGVGLGGPGVDRPGAVDDSGEMQEPLGQCGLTGVDMGQDAEVERTCGHA